MLHKLIPFLLVSPLLSSCASTPDPRFQDVNFEPGSANAILYEACDKGDGLSCLSLADKFDEGIGVIRHTGIALKYYNKACNLDNEEGCEVYFGVIDRATDALQRNTESALKTE